MDQNQMIRAPNHDGATQNSMFFIGPIMPFICYNKPLVKPFICHNKPFVVISKIRAFTLIELLITLAVVGILATISAPSMKQFIHSNRLSTATNELIADFNLARSEAIKRSISTGVCKSSGTACTTTGVWTTGWLVFADTDLTPGWSATDTVLRVHESLPGGISVTAAANVVMFSGQGLLSAGNGIYTLCSSEINKSRELNLTITGRVALGNKTC